jgi:ribosomal protein L37AE/L43A
MAKYVLLEFDDDAEAESFSNILIEDTTRNNSGSMRVRGVFKKPTQFCSCVPMEKSSVRGAKWGWWICKKCGKPKPGAMHQPRNLLEPEGTPSHQRRLFLHVAEPTGSIPGGV